MRIRLALTGVIFASFVSPAFAAGPKVTYIDHVQPIFRAKCFACHNPDKKSGGLDLTNFTATKEGGSSGEVVEPGDIESSYLWLVVNHDSEPYMPPKSDKLPAPMLAVIKAWIEGGMLDTKSSKVVIKKKPKVELALTFASNERPKEPPVPARLSLDPLIYTEGTTAINSIATSPWAPLVAISGQKQILLYNTQTLELIGVLPFPEGEPQVLRFSRNGQLLMAAGGTGSASGRVVVFNVKTGERIISVGDELDSVLGADISSDHKYIALGGPQKVVRVYSTETSELLYESRKHTEWITAVSFSPDGVLLATGDRNGGVFVWEAETGREYLGLRGHSKKISDFAWRSDSNVLASASEDTTVRLWEMENGGQIRSWGAHGGGTQSVWFTRDGQIATAGRDKTVKLWQQDAKAIRTFEAFADYALAVAYCDETKRVVGGDWTGLVRIWNAADGARLGELASNPPKLDARLAAATVELTRLTTDQKTKTDAYNAAVAVVTKMTADLNTVKKKVVDLTALEKQLQPKLTAAKQTATDAKTKHDAAAKTVATLQPLIPALKETIAKADVAAQKAAGDKEVAAVVAQLKTVSAARETTLTTATKSVTDEAARLKTATALATATEKQITDTKAGITATQKQVEALTAGLTAAQKTATDAKTALDQSTTTLASGQKAVDRWKDEIAFSNKLQTLQAQQGQVDDLELTFAEADAELQEMLKDVTTAQAAMTAAQQGEKVAQDAATAAKQKLAAVTADKNTQTKIVTDREAAVPILKDATDKGAAAAAAIAGDKELAAAAAQLKAAFDRNNKTIVDTKAKVVQLTTAMAAEQQIVTAMDQKLAQAKAVVVEAAKKVAAAQAAAKPIQEQVAKAKAAFDTARAALDQVKQEVDGLRQQASVATAQPGQG